MPKTHYTGGPFDQYGGVLSQYGPPGTPVGNVIFVGSTVTGATDSAGYGTTPENPLATLKYAVGSTGPGTADNGDVVVVLPGHVETITAAAGVSVAKAGLTIIGLGVGRQRPKINYTTAIGASFDIVSARTVVDNLVFTLTGFNAITAGINVTAADVTIRNCEIETGITSFVAVLGLLTTAAADRLWLDNNHIHGVAAAGTAAAARIVGGDAVRVTNNIIIGNFTTTLGGIDNATTAATNILIDGNKITNRTASASVAINAQAATTGQITNNRLSVLTGTAPIVAAGINMVGGNYYCAAAGVTAGTLI